MKLSIVVVFLLFIAVTSTWGYDCDRITSFKNADCVFIGKVVEISDVRSGFVRFDVTFRVIKTLKGEAISTAITVRLSCLSTMCGGFPFEMNKHYVVYATESSGDLYSDACSDNTILRPASLKYLFIEDGF